MNTIDTFLNDLDTYLENYVLNIFNILAPELRIMWVSMATLLIVFIGIRMIVKGDFHAGDFLINLFKIVIILALTTQWGNFSTFIYEIFTKLPTQIGELALSTDGGATNESISTALGKHYERLVEVGNSVLEGASWMDVGKFIVYGFLLLGAILLCFLGVGFISLAKVATAIMLAIAPVFILLLIFRQTSNLFEGWLKALFNYALLPLFVYLILGLALFLGEDILVKLETAASSDFTGLMQATVNYLLFAFVSFILLIQAPTISANVGGGFALSSMNAMQRMNLISKPVTRPAQNLARKAGAKSAEKGKSMVKNAVHKARNFRK